MTDWEQIALGEPKVLGVNDEFSGLLDVDVPLEPTPDVHWVALFDRGPGGHSFSMAMHPPRLHGSLVRIRPPDNELERYVDLLRDRVERTNVQYEREILPRLRGESEAAEREKADRQRRVEEAQRRLKSNGG